MVGLLAGGVLAAVTQTQTITQGITPVPIASSVVVNPLAVTKPNLQVDTMDQAANDTVIATVTVEIGNDDYGNWLHLAVDPDTTTLYANNEYSVVLTSAAGANQMSVALQLGVNSASAPHESIQLLEEGTYVFEEIAGGMAGDTPGLASVKVDVYLSGSS